MRWGDSMTVERGAVQSVLKEESDLAEGQGNCRLNFTSKKPGGWELL